MPNTANVRELWPLLLVRDMDRSVRHYTEGLGFDLVGRAETTAGDLFWCRLRRGGGVVMLQRAEDGDTAPGSPCPVSLYFVCEDVDTLFTELAGRGLDLEPPTDADYGMRQLFVPDPDGYEVCFETPTAGWEGE